MAQIKISELELNTQMSNEDVLAGVDTSEQKTKKFKLETLKTFINKEQDEQITKNKNDISANATNIENNTENISKNSENIKKNTQDIIENKENITDNTLRVKRLETDIFDSGEASGSSINLKDSTLAEFQEISVDGVCKQVTTNGTNLLNFNVNQLLDVTYNDDGTFTLNGSGNDVLKCEEITFEANKKYYQRAELVSGTISGIEGHCGIMDMVGQNFLILNRDTPIIFTEERTKNSMWVHADAVYDNARFKIWLSEEKTEWEPYTGGQASPSPSYPQPIEVIDEGFEVVSCSKNVCNITSVSPYSYASKLPNQLNDNIVIEKFDSNGFSYSVVGDSYYMGLTNNMYLKPNTNYKFSLFRTDNNVNNNARNYIYNVTNEGTYTLNKEYNATGELKNQFTTSETGIIALGLGAGNNSNGANGVIEKIMISEDSTEYEPYQETRVPINLPDGEFLGKINENAKDQVRISFNEDDGEYRAILEKNIGKVVLKGSENWIKYEQQTLAETVIFGADDIKSKVDCVDKCNMFQTGKSYWTTDEEGLYVTTSGLRIRIKSTRANSIEDFKTWLSENNVTVYYPLAKPYEMDLGVVEMPLSYSPETNVFTTSELEAIINAKYYRNFVNTVQNLQVNEKALREELVDIQNQLKALQVNVSNLSVLATNDEVESEVI